MQQNQYPSDISPFVPTSYPISTTIPNNSELGKDRIMRNDDSTIVNSKNKLLQRINQGLSVEFWKEYNSLISRFRLEKLSGNEAYRLKELGNEIERVNNERLELVIRMTKLNGETVEDLISELKSTDLERVKNGFSEETKKEVKQLSKGLCEFCQSQVAFSFTAYSINFFVPRKKFGKAESSNLVYACRGCSNQRYSKTKGFDPVSGSTTHLFNPRKDNWIKHFFWSDDFIYLIGKTDIGRSTIQELNLNRETLVKHRKILVSIQKHPFFLF